jgi:hypothetical protein
MARAAFRRQFDTSIRIERGKEGRRATSCDAGGSRLPELNAVIVPQINGFAVARR